MFADSFYEDNNFSDALVREGQLDKKEFCKCSFLNADFTDVSVLYGCKFENCNFSSASLNGVMFRSCAFINCNFHYANFFATIFDECKMTGSSFLHTDVSLLTIIGGDWSYTEMRYLEFDKKELCNISFEGADLTGSRFTKCRIEDCVFSQAAVGNMSFYQSDIRGSDLNDVDVLSIDLKNAIVDIQQCIIIAEAIGVKYKP